MARTPIAECVAVDFGAPAGLRQYKEEAYEEDDRIAYRKPGTSLEQFKRHYETVHAPGAIERIPALARADYRRNSSRVRRPAPCRARTST